MSNRLYNGNWRPWIAVSKTVNFFRIVWTEKTGPEFDAKWTNTFIRFAAGHFRWKCKDYRWLYLVKFWNFRENQNQFPGVTAVRPSVPQFSIKLGPSPSRQHFKCFKSPKSIKASGYVSAKKMSVGRLVAPSTGLPGNWQNWRASKPCR